MQDKPFELVFANLCDSSQSFRPSYRLSAWRLSYVLTFAINPPAFFLSLIIFCFLPSRKFGRLVGRLSFEICSHIHVNIKWSLSYSRRTLNFHRSLTYNSISLYLQPIEKMQSLCRLTLKISPSQPGWALFSSSKQSIFLAVCWSYRYVFRRWNESL